MERYETWNVFGVTHIYRTSYTLNKCFFFLFFYIYYKYIHSKIYIYTYKKKKKKKQESHVTICARKILILMN